MEGSNCCGQRSPSSPRRPAPRAQGTDVLAYKTQIKEKEGKINELVEELGNKELLLSEAQASLSKVGGRVLGLGGVGGCLGLGGECWGEWGRWRVGRAGWSGVGGLQWFMQLWVRPAACAKARGLSLVWGGVA